MQIGETGGLLALDETTDEATTCLPTKPPNRSRQDVQAGLA